MKRKINKIVKYILFDTFLYAIIVCFIALILNVFGYVFLKWFYNLSIILVVIGIIAGTIQLINEATSRKKLKVLLNIFLVIIEIIIIIPIVCIYFLFQDYEEIAYKDGNKMVKETHSFLFSNWINYYNYENIFVRKKQERIYEAHDDYIGEYLYTYYYNENGKLIKTDDPYYSNTTIYDEQIKANKSVIQNEVEKEEVVEDEQIEVLYEKKIDDKTSIRLVVKDYILAQRSLIGIQKTIDGGITWEEQLETTDKVMTIHNGAKFTFVNENIGFINDFGLAGTTGDKRQLLVTTNGGKSFKQVIIKSEQLSKNLYIDDVPYIQNNILKVNAHIQNNSNKESIVLYSRDDGVTWEKE